MNNKDIDNLSPALVGKSGTVFVNPGTGAVNNAEFEDARQNMVQLLRDAKLWHTAYFVAAPEADYGEGRFAFNVHHRHFMDYPCEVQMPGWELERVRYLGLDSQNIWHFPRLYVDGGSWMWEFAQEILAGFWHCSDCDSAITPEHVIVDKFGNLYCSEECRDS